MKQKTLDFLEAHQSETPSKWREEAEWRRDNWSASLSEDCRESPIADETNGTDSEGFGRTYELHAAVCLKDIKGKGEHVSRNSFKTGGCVRN